MHKDSIEFVGQTGSVPDPGLCPICTHPMAERFASLFLGKYAGTYDQCPDCQLLQVRTPDWLNEAYDRAICLADTGILTRNLTVADRLASLLPRIGGKGPYLDYGGGLGVLVRLMRDRGFDFRWSDRYASNELARGFEYDFEAGPCTAVTAFEVLEHVEEPLEFIEQALGAGRSDSLIFTTVLFNGEPPAPDWWYYARDEGQHISFFTRRSFEVLGNRLGLRFLSDGSLHMLTRTDLSEATFRRSLSRPARLLARLRRPNSLVQQDSLAMLKRIQGMRKGA